MDVFWEEWKSPSMLKWVQILSGLETLWDLPGKGRVEGRWESITSSEPERVRCGQRGDGHGELGQSFFFFFFFLHIYEFIISHLNAESIRIISCSSCPWLGQQGWSTLAALRLTHQQQHQPSGGGKTPAVAGCLPAISCGALCCDDREAMWRQLHRVLPPLPSAKSHQSPSPVWRTTEMLLAGLVFVPPTSQREAPLLTLITLRRLSTLLVGVDTMVLSVRVALGDFVEKKKKKERRRSNNPVAENRCKAKFSQNHREVKTVKIVKMNKKLLNKTCPNAKWMEWIRGEISNQTLG